MKPNHTYICIKAYLGFLEDEWYDTNENGDLLYKDVPIHVPDSDVPEYFEDIDDTKWYLTPKGCLSVALDNLGFEDDLRKLDVCFFLLETRMKENGFVSEDPNEGCETTETPESIFKKTIPLIYEMDENQLDALWTIFRDTLIKHQDAE